ncbi:MAG: insulinase family protein [Bacteroidetes bacterium]|nr:insulinase family protein [Bacteroidota bacterium]
MKYIGYLSTVILLSFCGMLSGAPGPDDYHITMGSNGQTYLLAQAPQTGVLYTDVYFRIGSVYELDSFSGVSELLSHVITAKVNSAIAGRNIKYDGELTPAQFGFHFQSASIDVVGPIIRDQICNMTISQDELQAAKDKMEQELDSLSRDDRAVADFNLKRSLWGGDARKLDIYGDRKSYKRIKVEEINTFHVKYFLPANNTVVITGAYAEQTMVDRLQEIFKDFNRTDFNPELITHVIDFKPTVLTVQQLSMSPGAHGISISYQQPGARQDRAGTYAAYMLSALANDPVSGLGALLRRDGLLTNVKAAYDCNNFQGTITLSADVPSGRYQAAFEVMDSAISAFCRKNFFKQEDLEAEHQRIQNEFNGLRKQTHTFMTQVARYRFTNDDYYFSSLADSIVAVDVPAMRRYVSDYFIDHAGIKCVYTDTAAINEQPVSQRYYAVNDSIRDITFTYPQNVTDIDSGAYTDFYKLLQWLKINPDVHVQVNGYSDKGEFVKAYDTTVTNFIWNTPTFRKAMPDKVKVKYLRIEMMRAMKIAKALYEAGIDESRISGTSMSFSSDDDQKAASNRKCTVTLEKIRPHMSLYEYHFGHKKDELPTGSGQ